MMTTAGVIVWIASMVLALFGGEISFPEAFGFGGALAFTGFLCDAGAAAVSAGMEHLGEAGERGITGARLAFFNKTGIKW